MTTENPEPAENPTPAAGPMTMKEYREHLLLGPDLASFRRMRDFESNIIWRLDTGTVANLLDEAIELIGERN